MAKKNEMFSEKCFLKASGVSRETLEQLSIYIELLSEWQKRVNLVSAKSMKEVWLRHVLDCAQIVPHLEAGGGEILDLGSGAGFPGLVLSIMGVSGLVLIESNKKKCTFLEEVIRHTGCEAIVYNDRIESFNKNICARYVLARALAPLDKLLQYSYPLVSAHGACFFLKGYNFEQELTQAKKSWSMSVKTHFSRDNPMISGAAVAPEKTPGVLLEIGNLFPARKKR